MPWGWLKSFERTVCTVFRSRACLVTSCMVVVAVAGIAVNTLWPRTSIATAAVEMLSGDEGMRKSRTVGIMADAATVILKSPSTKCTANFFIDDEVLAAVGVKDLSVYNVDPTVPQSELILDFFLPDA